MSGETGKRIRVAAGERLRAIAFLHSTTGLRRGRVVRHAQIGRGAEGQFPFAE